MSIIWSEEIDPILSRGIPLCDLGVRNWALTRDHALHAIYQLEALGVAILGGDVYRLVGETVALTYDSWHCDQGPDEAGSDFSKRSSDAATSYILNYLMSEGLFSLVPKV